MKQTSETTNNMFSRYTWWDLFIVGGIITALYYTYIAVVYYREDIREWISNKGSSKPASSATADESVEEQEDEPNLYSVHTYGLAEPSATSSSSVAAPPVHQPAPAPIPSELNAAGPDLAGPVFNEDQPAEFDLPINGSAYRQTEERVDDILDAAGRVSKDENGLVKANDEQDLPAVRIASTINY